MVDDDPGILKFVSGLLVDDDYHVLTASSGEAALQQSKDYKGEIHLLLSDFQMPAIEASSWPLKCAWIGRSSKY